MLFQFSGGTPSLVKYIRSCDHLVAWESGDEDGTEFTLDVSRTSDSLCFMQKLLDSCETLTARLLV